MLHAKSLKELESAKLVKERSPPIIVKDQKYLMNVVNTGFGWNNKHRLTEKYYPFYHKYHDKAIPNIEKLKLEEQKDKKIMEKMRIQRLAENRAEALNRIHDRAQERKLIQIKSRQAPQQFIAEELDRMILPYEKTLEKKAIMTKHAVHTDNKWNFLLEHDQKRAQLYVTPPMVKGEESLISHVQKKVKEEMELEALREKAFRDSRLETLERFHKRRTSHTERSQGKGAPNPLTLDLEEHEIRYKTNETPSGHATSLNTLRSNLLSPQPRSLGYIPEEGADPTKTQLFNLTAPKKKMFVPKNALDRPEFKGMLIKHCSEGISEEVNPMVAALTSHSQFFTRVNSASKSIRKLESQMNSIATTHPHTLANLSHYPKESAGKSHNTLSKESFYGMETLLPSSVRELNTESRLLPTRSSAQVARSCNDLEDISYSLNELDEFDKRYLKPIKYIGYPRSDLDVATYQNETKFRSKLPDLSSHRA